MCFITGSRGHFCLKRAMLSGSSSLIGDTTPLGYFYKKMQRMWALHMGVSDFGLFNSWSFSDDLCRCAFSFPNLFVCYFCFVSVSYCSCSSGYSSFITLSIIRIRKTKSRGYLASSGFNVIVYIVIASIKGHRILCPYE